MNIELADFQLKAIADLMEAMECDKKEIILKSCTGSGKTIILTHFMDEYLKSYNKQVFIWLTPGKGNLEEQSKEKMDRYIHGSRTKLLCDVMAGGFEENDCCFINWEKLTKKGNNALKDSERVNFLDCIFHALEEGLTFKIIVDESHQNDTIKAEEIIDYFKTEKIVRCSATPKNYKDAYLIEIPEEDVIAEGLIKKLLLINENFEQNISVEDQVSYLMDKALTKRRKLHSEFLRRKAPVNPLIVVQLPNKSDVLLESIETYLSAQGITYENNQLAVWLADKKQNLESISENNAESIVVIIKQAIATGWDCPRAHILVKLRDNMSETFEIQTIGRIRRMPEAKHYEDDLLDCCYLYTLDEKFTENVKRSLGKGALEERDLTLKREYSHFTLICQQKTNVPFPRDAKLALKVIKKYFSSQYNLDGKAVENRKKLEAHKYDFNTDIIDYTKSGELATLSKEEFDNLNEIKIREKLTTHKHGKEYHHCVAEIGMKVGLDYNNMNTIVRRLFLKDLRSEYTLLILEIRELYAFVINNKPRLIDDIRIAMASETAQIKIESNMITEKPWSFPLNYMFAYDSSAKDQMELIKNVYKGYRASAEVRSEPEKIFEKYCESNNHVEWFYKNGDKGNEYFSIVYEDNAGKQKSFYPDYIVHDTEGNTWIIETKGGFSKSGQSEDIDKFTSKKFAVLKKYLDKYNLQGGIVRQDKQSSELCICTEEYSNDIKDDNWKLLKEIL